MNNEGTQTGRVSSAKPARSNRPKSSEPRQVVTKNGTVFYASNTGVLKKMPAGVEMPGMHLGPRTKADHPYSYDPLLVYATGEQADGSVYSDRFRMWYDSAVLKSAMERHFGKTGDYYYDRSPTAIEAFLRDLLGKPQLRLVRIEEHCNVSNGYPCWFFAYQSGDAPTKN